MSLSPAASALKAVISSAKILDEEIIGSRVEGAELLVTWKRYTSDELTAHDSEFGVYCGNEKLAKEAQASLHARCGLDL